MIDGVKTILTLPAKKHLHRVFCLFIKDSDILRGNQSWHPISVLETLLNKLLYGKLTSSPCDSGAAVDSQYFALAEEQLSSWPV